jgi:hypothetical protein
MRLICWPRALLRSSTEKVLLQQLIWINSSNTSDVIYRLQYYYQNNQIKSFVRS